MPTQIMPRLLLLAILLLIAAKPAQTVTLKDRFDTKLREPHSPVHDMDIAAHHQHQFVASNNFAGLKSYNELGSFRGRPIVTRQKSSFVDANGDTVMLVPYTDAGRRIQSRPNRYGPI
ncbi:hypothetical protein Q1695_012451 [Nippostrongylus brasiliensis]|nr:hypothetical protein Q1695_012451 [Nippostrongylus brasiliensis]